MSVAYNINSQRAPIVVGQRFGRLVILREMPIATRAARMVECICDCGTEKIISLNALRTGNTVSCGCQRNEQVAKINFKHGLARSTIPHNKRIVLAGEKFGLLTVIEEVEPNKFKQRQFLCACDCGQTKVILLGSMITGRTISCGHVRDDVSRERCLTTLKREKTKHPLYLVWRGIKVRCYNPKCRAFKRYGGRGIRIADNWKGDPEAFVSWCLAHGWTPELTVDRIDPDRHYEPDNIQFLSKPEHFTKTRHDVRLRKQANYISGALSLLG